MSHFNIFTRTRRFSTEAGAGSRGSGQDGYWVVRNVTPLGQYDLVFIPGQPAVTVRNQAPSRLVKVAARLFSYTSLALSTYFGAWLLGRFATVAVGVAGATLVGTVSSTALTLMLAKDLPVIPLFYKSVVGSLVGGTLSTLGLGHGMLSWLGGYIPPPGDFQRYFRQRVMDAGRKGLTW